MIINRSRQKKIFKYIPSLYKNKKIIYFKNLSKNRIMMDDSELNYFLVNSLFY